MKKNKRLVLCLCMAAVLLLSACGRKFDAQGYVRGVLDVTFQNEPSQALRTMEDVTREDLEEQYEAGVQKFVENNITNEIEMNEIKEGMFIELCKEIFATMKYSVKEAEETGKKEYEVPVEIKPSDVFIRFQEALVKDSEKIAASVEAGQYKGTEDEIARQVLNDIINHAYELLSVSYMDMEFGETQTVILKVEAGKDNEYSINDEDMDNLIIKILRLDEIQG